MLDEFLNKEYTKKQREKYPNIILFFDYIKTLPELKNGQRIGLDLSPKKIYK